MGKSIPLGVKLAVLALMLYPTAAYAADGAQTTVQYTGVSGLWILANISYAGMRAQANPNGGWRILSFIFGFPGTFISWLAITEGGERAYGIDLPKRNS